MTLTEVCVYCTLLSIFALMLFINLPTRGAATSEELRAAVSKADTVLERLTLELGNASANSVTQVKTAPAGLIFLTASIDGFEDFTYTSTGDLAWLGWVGYFQVDDKLVRLYYPFKAGVARSAITSTPTYAEMVKGGSGKVLCDDVSGFNITLPEANLWQFDLQLTVGGSQVTFTSGGGARN